MTADQAARFLPTLNVEGVDALLEQAVRDKRLACQEVELPVITEAKVRKGQTKTRPITIYYLTDLGKKMLRRTYPRTRFLKTTRPVKEHYRRLYHDLLIVEVLLWWLDNYEVLGYLNEDDLRGDREEVLADLRVFCTGPDGEVAQTDCEILVQNTLEDVADKSDQLFWFTPTLRQADIIHAKKPNVGVMVIQLQGDEEENALPEEPQNDEEREMITVLNLHGGALTVRGVATYLDRDRARTNSVLARMVRNRSLFVSTVHRFPGSDLGRPVQVFSRNKYEIALLEDRIFAYRVSKAITQSAERGHRVTAVDRDSRTVTVTDGRNTRTVAFAEVAYA